MPSVVNWIFHIWSQQNLPSYMVFCSVALIFSHHEAESLYPFVRAVATCPIVTMSPSGRFSAEHQPTGIVTIRGLASPDLFISKNTTSWRNREPFHVSYRSSERWSCKDGPSRQAHSLCSPACLRNPPSVCSSRCTTSPGQPLLDSLSLRPNKPWCLVRHLWLFSSVSTTCPSCSHNWARCQTPLNLGRPCDCSDR